MSGTNDHLSAAELERYRQRRMTPAELLAADDHLSQCDLCYGNLDGPEERSKILGSAAQAFRAAVADHIEHPSADELFDYTDGRVDEIQRETIETHLEECAQCRMQAIDLRSTSLDMASGRGRTYRPRAAGAAPPAARKSGDQSPHSVLGPGPWQARSTQIGIRIAGALALIIAVAWGTSLPLRNKIARLEEDNARIKQSNAELERQASSLKDLQDQIAELTRRNEALRGPGSEDRSLAAALSEPGGVIGIDKDGTIHGLPAIDAGDAEAARAALVAGRVKASADVAALREKPGHLMGGARAPYGLVAPVATVVADQRPGFRWHPVERAANYVVSVYADDFKVAARSEPLSATEWKPPANLERGRTYTWQVRAVVDSSEEVLPPPAAPEAKFKILAGNKVSELARVRQAYAGSHLMQGIAYARLGLIDEAERQFQALVSANPKSELARKLLASVKSLRPRY